MLFLLPVEVLLLMCDVVGVDVVIVVVAFVVVVNVVV